MQLTYKWQAAIVVALGMFMALLDNTIVNVALPRMQSAFDTDWQSVVWVASAFSSAAVIPVTGYLSDRLGSKRVWIASLAFFWSVRAVRTRVDRGLAHHLSISSSGRSRSGSRGGAR